MIRGTTAQFKFTLPCTFSELEWAAIKFWQSNNNSSLLPITKTLQHCSCSDDLTVLYVSLTSEETTRFSDKYKAIVQFRAKNATNGTVFGSKERYISVYPMRDDGQGEEPVLPEKNQDGFIIFDGQAIL